MKRTVAGIVLLVLMAAVGGAVYLVAARERDYRLQLDRGDVALSARKTSEAIEAYSGAMALRPDSMLAYLRRGEAYLQRNDLDQAARDVGRAAALDPGAPRALEELGDVEYRRQRFDQAGQAYESRLRLDERSTEVTYKLALARYRGGDLDGALRALDQVIKLSDELADAYYLKGLCLRDERRIREAVDAFGRAVKLSPASIPAREELAGLYRSLGHRADEIEQLEALAVLDREHVERQVAVGLAQAAAGHWDVAVLTLGSALERAPNEPVIYAALGRVWLDRPRERNDRVYLSKAREALQRIAPSPTATSEALTLYGRALAQDGDFDGAERTFQQALARYPVDPSAFLEYASVAEHQNHLDAARAALIDYGALAVSEADFVGRASRIGTLSLRLDDASLAVTWLQRAVDASPGDVRLLASLAEAQLRAGDREAAEATVERGLEKDAANAALRAVARRLGTL